MLANGTRRSFNPKPHLKPIDDNNVEIRYAGLSFIAPEKVTFRYRLVGYDRSWVDAATRREAFYTNLPPGNFDFLVQARNADGVWSPKPASLQFVVEPKLYQRPWFVPLLLLTLASAIAAGYRMRIRQLRNRFNLILAERNRIARELHDTLLQGLSGITMQLQALWTKMPPSQEKRTLAEIISDAGHCSAEARQSLWGLRNNTPSNLEFSEKLAKLAREAVSDRPMSLSLKVEPVTLRKFPDTEYQLLRIASEAITNTLKHAAATQLRVALSVVDSVLKLTVEDNGTGFSPDAQSRGGHFGLHGIRERVAEIGGELSIDSSPENGTRVLVFLELPEHFEAGTNRAEAERHQLQ
jgi:signal transduction histidine kinase